MVYEPKWLQAIRRQKGGPRLIAKYNKPKDSDEGERLPDFVHYTGNEHFRLDQAKPRAYVKCVGPERVSGQGWVIDCPVSWWYCDPLGHWGTLATADVVEHEDGTISVRGTINNHGPYEPWWRGTLLRGVWSGHAIPVEASQAVE